MKKLLFVTLACVTQMMWSQVTPYNYHMMNWHFGNQCSIDFSSGTPVPGTSNINTFEGCSAMSDASTGSLLFYTDGMTVYDKFGNTMLNGTGLFGHGSSAQSAIIVPTNITGVPEFFVFTSDQAGYVLGSTNKGVHYSIVDMSLNGGLGAVTIKNVPVMTSQTEERMAVVRACNGTDFWLVLHKFQTDSFFVFPVTSTGIGAPVISKIGSVHNNISGQFYEGVGCMAVSPDGDKLALSVYHFENFVELFHFNQSTGQITNPVKLDATNLALGAFQPYGVAFSADSKKLYFSHTNENYVGPNSFIMQVDIANWNQSTIAASNYVVSSITNNWYWNLALGPDNKIYSDKGYLAPGLFLDVIGNPNSSGAACNFQLNGLQVTGGTNLQNGFPSFYTELLPGDVSCDMITSLNENKKAVDFSLFPNPSHGKINISIGKKDNYKVEAYNSLGQLVLSENIQNSETFFMDLEMKCQGLIFIKISDTKGNSRTEKCIID
jgi:hypothetical protein